MAFRIGIIGAGGIANAHAAAAKDSQGQVEIAGVADMNREAAEKFASANGATAFESAEALIKAAKTNGIGAIVVCTPPSARLPIVAAALKAKLPVMTEKPIAHTLADAKKLESLAKKNKKVVTAIGYCHRFTPAVLKMKELIAEGRIGRLERFENFFACDLPGHQGKWFSDPKKAGGGAFLDMGSHSMDLFHFVVGPSKVVGAVFDYKWKGRTETGATVLVKSTKKGGPNNPGNVAGVILSGWAETSRFTVSVLGDKGMLSYDYENPEVMVFKDLLGKVENHAIETCGVRFTRQLVAFAHAAQGTKQPGLATFADGLAAAAADAAARKAAK
jgi:predicted dehydrogenase